MGSCTGTHPCVDFLARKTPAIGALYGIIYLIFQLIHDFVGIRTLAWVRVCFYGYTSMCMILLYSKNTYSRSCTAYFLARNIRHLSLSFQCLLRACTAETVCAGQLSVYSNCMCTEEKGKKRTSDSIDPRAYPVEWAVVVAVVVVQSSIWAQLVSQADRYIP